MKASEALKKLREKGSLDEMIGMIMGDPLKRAIEALEREADAEEKAKPKVTLEEQAEACGCIVAGLGLSDIGMKRIAAAADTIRRLDEEGGKLLHESLGIIMSSTGVRFRDLLRSLGVEPRS